ncbi:class I SAM-dependent methyltransferase [Sporolactobacillus shoreicorticis]|uniref:S-adenosyl-L-methionine-dependent methyltransferase n=1 Tax=Sporolactobacillus shoreicorticis TaxID=1923877 RepID=A0ABW5S519_9BACL|nr:class I SAM-dependent methyltransferase [Sporolactobacillus shoreicorticis]MCO7126507.1 class I SAM-dependent methyltransferase [Sporolactobacillus shoreicorticis]
MKDQSSITALVSAFSRAYHSQYDHPKVFDDSVAAQLITAEEFDQIKKNMIQGISFFNKKVAVQLANQPDELLKWITQVQLSPTPLARAAFCEQILFHEIDLGTTQYVILGAGLDTFCFRHPEVSRSLQVFEVDHPATQTFKKKRLAESHLTIPDHLHFVPMDFTREFSEQKLVGNEFENRRTFFSLLGVTYYLSKKEIAQLIKNLFALVPSGSSIVFDHADEALFETKGRSNRVENMVKMAAGSGEPMKSCFPFTELEHLLENAGLLVYEHLSPDEINERYYNERHDYLSAFETIHYVHAVKR